MDDSDAEVLFPDREVVIGGQTITVREFTYAETLRLSGRMRGLLERIADEFGADPEVGDIDAVIADHADEWLELLALSSGLDPTAIETLSKTDGAALSLAMWSANLGFFCRRYWKRIAASVNPSASAPSSLD